MTLSELEEKIQEILPSACLDTDHQGQIIIYTGMTADDDEELVEHEV